MDTPQDLESEAESAQANRARARSAPYPPTRPKETGLPKRTPDQRPADAEAPAPDELLLASLHLPGQVWSIKEDGGGGDCAFKAVARAIAHRKGLDPSPEELQREAATLRLLTVGHLSKHKQRFSEFWVAEDPAIDPAAVDEPQYWGGNSPPSTFECYITMMAKREAYADGVALQALCERLGTPLVVWHYQAQDSTWQRSVLAPFEREGCAGTARKSPPAVTLVLRDAHYRSLLGPPDEDCPSAWLTLTAPRPRHWLRGGGKGGLLSLPSATPPRSSVRGRTPTLRSGEAVLSLPSRTPSRGSSRSLAPKTRCFSSPDPVPFPKAASGVGSLSSATPRPRKRPRTAAAAKDGPSQASSAVLPAKASECSRSEQRSRCFKASEGSGPSQKGAPKPAGAGAAPTSGKRAPRGHGKRSRESTAEGRELWWTCDCGFKVFRHGALKNHCYHRKRHLHLAHGIPWEEIGPGPKSPPKEAFPGSALYAAAKWKILRRLFLRNAWPGAHRVAEKLHESSKRAAPMHQCCKCKRVLRRAQLCTTLCEKQPSSSRAPALSKRKKLWKTWVSQAETEAAKQRVVARDRRVQEARKDLACSTAACKKQSGARTVAVRPVQGAAGLPAFEASSSSQAPRAWWTCPVPGCGFSLQASDPGKSGKRKVHLIRNHGKDSYQPLAKGDLQALVNRLPAARKTYDERWEYVFAQWSQSGWKGTHRIGKDPCAYRQYHNSKGLPYYRALFRCGVCQNTVEKSQIPREVCPAAKGRASPSLGLRVKQWKLWGAQARATIGKTVIKKLARKNKRSASQSAVAGS